MPLSGGFSPIPAAINQAFPVTSYAQLMQLQNQEAQFAAQIAQKAERDKLLQQQTIEQAQKIRVQMQQLPFEAPDKQRLKQWLQGKEKETAERIKTEYDGDNEKFMAAEGLGAVIRMYSEMQNTPLWAAASQNKEMVAMAKDAIKKNHNLIGDLDGNGNYRNNEDDLRDYYLGKNPVYRFNGSYDPKTDVMEHYSKIENQYGSKFDRSAVVPQQDVLNYLQAQKGSKEGLDLYNRNYKGRNLRYKQASPEDEALFNLDILNKRSAILERGARIDKMNSDAQANMIKAQAKAAGGGGGQSMFDESLGTKLTQSPMYPITQDPTNPMKTIKTLGVPISALSTDGNNVQFIKHPGQAFGDNFLKMAGLFGKGAQASEIFITSGKGNSIDLSGVPHKVISVDENPYLDGKAEVDYTTAGKGGRPNRSWAKTRIVVDRDTAESLGLLSTWGPNHLTEAGSGLTKDANDNVIIEGYVPVQGFWENKTLDRLGSKAVLGQKEANESDYNYDPYQESEE